MSRIKEFMFKVAEDLGIEPDQVTNEQMQEALEKLYGKQENIEPYEKDINSTN